MGGGCASWVEVLEAGANVGAPAARAPPPLFGTKGLAAAEEGTNSFASSPGGGLKAVSRCCPSIAQRRNRKGAKCHERAISS